MKFKLFKETVVSSNYYPKGIYSFLSFLAEKHRMQDPKVSDREIHKGMFPREYIYKTRKGRSVKKNMTLRKNALKRNKR